jgi:tetratricopeptide (TPR) repeat protein
VNQLRSLSPALAAAGDSLFGSAGLAWDTHQRHRPLYDAPAVRLLAASAARRGNLTKAARLLLELIVANPADRDMKLVLVSLMILRDQPTEALALLEEFLSADPDDAQMEERKAFVLGHLGRLDEAVQIYSQLIAAFPRDPALLVARGYLLLAIGSEQAAVADYRRAIDCDARFGEAWCALANSKTVRLSDADIHQIQRVLSGGELSPRSRVGLEFALGKAFEDRDMPELSFEHYRRGNELQAQGAFNARAATEKHVDEAIACFDARYFAQRSGLPAEAPIFIVGMPRSGTTLIEQILASHPDVEGTFELPTVSAIARSIGESLGRTEFDYSDMLRGYSDAALQALGQRYLSQSAVYRRTTRPFFIDKMPSNWMHVGLIRAILPQARIIDVRRDPLDCCFSNYAQHYPRGHEFTHSLDDLGRHYRNYERLMAHFDAVAPGAITRVQYEGLVEQPEATIRDLLERLRLPFADSCLRFFENDRSVRTPSAQQVRQPINRRGIGRWRQYEPWLGPLIEALGLDDAAPRPA